jgi:hypothetical protein
LQKSSMWPCTVLAQAGLCASSLSQPVVFNAILS